MSLIITSLCICLLFASVAMFHPGCQSDSCKCEGEEFTCFDNPACEQPDSPPLLQYLIDLGTWPAGSCVDCNDDMMTFTVDHQESGSEEAFCLYRSAEFDLSCLGYEHAIIQVIIDYNVLGADQSSIRIQLRDNLSGDLLIQWAQGFFGTAGFECSGFDEYAVPLHINNLSFNCGSNVPSHAYITAA